MEEAPSPGDIKPPLQNTGSWSYIKCSKGILPMFTANAEDNTLIGKETLGLLCGRKEQHNFVATHLVIPDQINSSDSCTATTLGESQLLDVVTRNGLVVLGWIHTHPTWDVFMSSVDVHMQYIRERLLPESIAIVLSPQHRVSGHCVGIYHLSDLGTSEISQCKEKGFHRHEQIHKFYKNATHFELVDDAPTLHLENFCGSSSSTLVDNGAPWTWTFIDPPSASEGACENTATISAENTSSSSASNLPSTSGENTSSASAHSKITSDVVHSKSTGSCPRADLGNQQVEFFHQYAQRAEASDKRMRTIHIIRRCNKYNNIEELCSLATNSIPNLRKDIIDLENALIDTVSGDLSTGMMYMSTFLVKNRYLYTRWMDSGSLQGFVSAKKSDVNVGTQRTQAQIKWQVMTTADLETRSKNYQASLNAKRQKLQGNTPLAPTGKRWEQVVGNHKRQNAKSVNAALAQLEKKMDGQSSDIKILGVIVHIDKKEHQANLVNISKSEYHRQHGIYKDTDFNGAMHDHRLHRDLSPTLLSFEQHVDAFNDQKLGLEDQETVINAIGNDSSSNRGVTSARRVSFFSTGSATEISGKSKYAPTSLRNRVLYHDRMYDNATLIKLLCTADVKAPQRKRPSSSSRSTSLAHNSGPNDIPSDPIQAHDPIDPVPLNPVTPFDMFVQGVIGQNGVLNWRVHTTDVDIIAMNDISLHNGSFSNNTFVHITRQVTRQGTPLFSCTCKMATTVQRMDEGGQCCHVRFFHLFIEQHLSVLFDDQDSLPLTPIVNKIKASTSTLNNGAVKLGSDDRFHRFSVMTPNLDCAIVKLEGNRFSCQGGRCRADKGHTRKIHNIGDENRCPHIQVLNANRESWTTLVSANEEEDDEPAEHTSDQHPSTQPTSSFQNFNPTTGLWNFPSLSKHIPRQQDDIVFKQKADYRRSMSSRFDGVCLKDGYYMDNSDNSDSGAKPFKLSPYLDKECVCQCGDKYWNDVHPDGIIKPRYSHATNVYLQHGVAKFMVYDRHCIHDNPSCSILYNGRQDALHFLTSHTAAGDEIGWDFVNEVTTSETPITAFCENITKVYYETHLPFMSRTTFTDFIFSWLSNFQIDFRQVCDTCGHNPKILACDGTKLGIFFRNASTITSVEEPTCSEEVSPSHTRCERQYFSYKNSDSKQLKSRKRLAQEDLGYFVAKHSNHLKEWQKSRKIEGSRSEDERKQHLLGEIPTESVAIVTKFLERDMSHELLQCLCPLFKLLASGAPMTSLFHFSHIPSLLTVLSGSSELESLKDDMPEIYSLLFIATKDGQLDIVSKCLRGIISTILLLHSHDNDTASSSEVCEVYNPEVTGRAYYFTPHGGRIRNIPKYTMSRDSQPADPSCRKKFEDATKSGTTFLFLWFDPLHGHCYGFHIIKSSEGRKDPFASLFSYMEDCPSAVFYDFSCQLEEFCLNREPKFWRDCRFFHDIFHGFSHKCPYVYNSKRIPSLDIGINTEICEQFNSYIQKIKYSARAMNQSHFTFYMQFFIHLWNKKKAVVLAQENRVARSLMQ